jgi:hypothetical protein
MQDGTIVTAGSRHAAAEDPILTLRLRHGIEVEQDLPVGRGAAIALQCRATPQAARMIRILPEIVEQAAETVDDRQLIGPVERRLHRIAVRLVPRVGQAGEGRRVLGRDPGEGAIVLHLFEPGPRIIVGSGKGRPWINGA